MPNRGDDCYFFFYSTCAKGDDCPFRHCEAAIGNETVCTLWQEGRCFRQVCKFRHMEIDKKRSEIPCYWENQISGCQKANCAFHHTRERLIEGIILPPSKTVVSRPKSAEEEVNSAQPSVTQAKLPFPPNTSPQLRSVMKVDNETVPSPTHPPVVINAADDDEDDDGTRLSAGIRSLRHVKSKKLSERGSHLGSVAPPVLCVASAPLQSLPGTEENIRSVMRTVTLSNRTGGDPCFRLSLAGRLEKRKAPFIENPLGDIGPPLKRSLAERLGRKIRSPERLIEDASQKVQATKSVKERLGFPADQSRPETVFPTQAALEIRIKTLEEIRLEKLSQRPEQDPQPTEDGTRTSEDPSTRAQSGIHIKSFMEVLAEKKLRQMEDAERHRVENEGGGLVQEAEELPKELPAQAKLRDGCGKVQLAELSGKRAAMVQVRVKTLEEIKREKALRQQRCESDATNGASQADPITSGRRLLLTAKPAAVKEEKLQAEQCIVAAPRPSAGGDAVQPYLDRRVSNPNTTVLVKSFEEIMREKRQRKQQEQAMQLLKAHAPLSLLESSPIGEVAAIDSTQPAGVTQPTAAKEPAHPGLATRLLHVRPQHTSPGKCQQLSPGGHQGASLLSPQKTSPVRPQQTSPKKPLQSRLRDLSPMRHQQPSSPGRPGQPSSPGRPKQPSPGQPSSPGGTQQPSSPGRTQQPSPGQPSSPVKPQQPSSPVRLQQPLSPGKPKQLLSPIQPSSPIQSHQQPSPVKAQKLSSSVQPQLPLQVKTEESSQVMPQELSPVRQQETLPQDILETSSPEAEGSTVDAVPVGQPTKTGRGKPKASVKPSIGKKRGPAKGPQKRKGSKSQPTAVAAVKPLSPEITSEEPAAKKPALVANDSSPVEQMPPTRAGSEISKDSTAPPSALPAAPTPAAEKGSLASPPASVRTRRASASAPKTPVSLEDDLDKLMWEVSGGRLGEEAEIDLDAGKDQDDLLLELDEMIDS